jgi:uncharacterized RDD family membrane protein YckC
VAGLGSRVAAALVDYTILVFGYLAVLFGAAFVSGVTQSFVRRYIGVEALEAAARVGGYAALAGGLFLVFVAWWGYFLLFEMMSGGQSPGKKVMGLRVVRRDGQPLSFTTSLVRNTLRWIDQPGIGVFVMLVDSLSRRLGDMAAGTFVIREPRSRGASGLMAVELPEVPEERVLALPNAGRITMGQYTLIRDYFARAPRLQGDAAANLAARLASHLARELEADPTTVAPPERFLATVARAFEERHRYAEGAPTASGLI